jgi:hypothetical protein
VRAQSEEIQRLHVSSKLEGAELSASLSWRDRFNSSAMDLLKVCCNSFQEILVVDTHPQDRVIRAEAEVAQLRAQTSSLPATHPR